MSHYKNDAIRVIFYLLFIYIIINDVSKLVIAKLYLNPLQCRIN